MLLGMTFPKYIVNSIFCKTLKAHEDKSYPNPTAKQKEPVIIYFRSPYYGDKIWLLFSILFSLLVILFVIKACVRGFLSNFYFFTK